MKNFSSLQFLSISSQISYDTSVPHKLKVLDFSHQWLLVTTFQKKPLQQSLENKSKLDQSLLSATIVWIWRKC